VVSHHVQPDVEGNHFHQAACIHHQTQGTAEPPAAFPQQQLACEAGRNKLADSSQRYEGQDHPPVAPGVDGPDVGLDSTTAAAAAGAAANRAGVLSSGSGRAESRSSWRFADLLYYYICNTVVLQHAD